MSLGGEDSGLPGGILIVWKYEFSAELDDLFCSNNLWLGYIQMRTLFHLSTLFPLTVVGMVSCKLLSLNWQSHPLHSSRHREGGGKEGRRKESGSIVVCLSWDSSSPVLHVELKGPESLPGHRGFKVIFRLKVERALSYCFQLLLLIVCVLMFCLP